MKWKAKTATHDFVIEKEDWINLVSGKSGKSAFILYVFENGKVKFDHMQETLEWAMTQALEDFGVPKDAWQEVND